MLKQDTYEYLLNLINFHFTDVGYYSYSLLIFIIKEIYGDSIAIINNYIQF